MGLPQFSFPLRVFAFEFVLEGAGDIAQIIAVQVLGCIISVTLPGGHCLSCTFASF